jgi:hypothetical protein
VKLLQARRLASMSRNEELLSHLRRSGSLKSDRVCKVMRSVDRLNYVTSGNRFQAYEDHPLTIGDVLLSPAGPALTSLAIGHGATISAPHMHAACLDLLEPQLQPVGIWALAFHSLSHPVAWCRETSVLMSAREVAFSPSSWR